MSVDPDESAPSDPLPEVPLLELIERARAVADKDSLKATRGKLIVALRSRHMKWRDIEAETGIPHGTARRWAKIFLDTQR